MFKRSADRTLSEMPDNRVSLRLVEGRNPVYGAWDPYLELPSTLAALELGLLDGPILADEDYITDRSGPAPSGHRRYLSLEDIASPEEQARYRARVTGLLAGLIEEHESWVLFLGYALDREDEDTRYYSRYIGYVDADHLELNGGFSIVEVPGDLLTHHASWFGHYDGVSGLCVPAGDLESVLARLSLAEAIPTGQRWCQKSPFSPSTTTDALARVLEVGRLWFEETDNCTRLRFIGERDAIAKLRAEIEETLQD